MWLFCNSRSRATYKQTDPWPHILSTFTSKMLQMQKTIDSMEEPTSSYNPSNPSTLADLTVYPPPSSTLTSEPASKKRKVANGDVTSEGTTGSEGKKNPGGAVYPQLIHINTHLRELQLNNKKECEEMIYLCVSKNVSLPSFTPCPSFQAWF